jgi:hypothetical protein
MSDWRIPMSADPGRIEFELHANDPRLIAAVSPIVRHAAHRAGLSVEAQNGFATAIVAACRETFALLNGHDSSLRIVASDFPDHVEVTLEHTGEALPTAGLDSFCAGASNEVAAGISMALQKTDVDRVQYDTREGHPRMTLIKYCGGRKANA